MKRICTATASAVLIIWAMPSAHAAQAQGESAGARETIVDIDNLTNRISERAFELNQMAKRGQSSIVQLEGLNHLRDDVNKVAADLDSLEAKKEDLADWEVKALDRTLPVMREVAGETGKAIQFFNTDRSRLWSTPYLEDTSEIAKDAKAVSAMLRDYLKLEGDREQEAQLERKLSETR